MSTTTPHHEQGFNHLRGQLLVAMPGLTDPGFAHSVVYICEHTPEGAMGLTINRPLGLPLSQIFAQLNLPCPEKLGALPLLLGGPVQQERGFVLHRSKDQQWQSTVSVSDQISLTASRDIIEAIAHEEGPAESLIILGYAGWGAGQLEQELLANAWLTVPADAEFLFDTPLERCAHLAAARIGINLNQLSNSAGHA